MQKQKCLMCESGILFERPDDLKFLAREIMPSMVPEGSPFEFNVECDKCGWISDKNDLMGLTARK